MAYKNHDYGRMSYNTEDAELTNVLPPLDVWSILNSNLQTDFVKELIGKVSVDSNNYDSVKKIYGVKSPNYKPREIEYVDVKDGVRYREIFARPHIEIEGAFAAEADLMLHEAQRYLSNLYPETLRSLDLLTDEEITDSFNETFHMLGYEIDSEVLDVLLSKVVDIKDARKEAFYQKYKLLISLAGLRQGLGTQRSVKSLLALLGFKSNIYNLAFSQENLDTMYPAYTVQSIIAYQDSLAADLSKAATTSMDMLQYYEDFNEVNATQENLAAIHSSDDKFIKVGNLQGFSTGTINLLSTVYSQLLSENLNNLVSSKDLLPKNIFSRTSSEVFKGIYDQIFDEPLSDEIINGEQYTFISEDVNNDMEKSTGSTYRVMIADQNGKTLAKSKEAYFMVDQTIGLAGKPIAITDETISAYCVRVHGADYSTPYRVLFDAIVKEHQVNDVSGYSGQYAKYCELFDPENNQIGFYLQSMEDGSILFSNITLSDNYEFNPVFVEDVGSIISYKDAIRTEEHFIPLKLITASLLFSLKGDNISYQDVAAVKQRLTAIMANEFSATDSISAGLHELLNLKFSETKADILMQDVADKLHDVILGYMDTPYKDVLTLFCTQSFKMMSPAETIIAFKDLKIYDVVDILHYALSAMDSVEHNLLDDIKAESQISTDMIPSLTAIQSAFLFEDIVLGDDLDKYESNVENLYTHYGKMVIQYDYLVSTLEILNCLNNYIEWFHTTLESVYNDPDKFEGYYLELPQSFIDYVKETISDFSFSFTDLSIADFCAFIGRSIDLSKVDLTNALEIVQSVSKSNKSFRNVNVDLIGNEIFASSVEDAAAIHRYDTLKIIIGSKAYVAYVKNEPSESENRLVSVDWPTKPVCLETMDSKNTRAIASCSDTTRFQDIEALDPIYNHTSLEDQTIPVSLSKAVSNSDFTETYNSLDTWPIESYTGDSSSIFKASPSLMRFMAESLAQDDELISNSGLDSSELASTDGMFIAIQPTDYYNYNDETALIYQEILDLLSSNIKQVMSSMYGKNVVLGPSVNFVVKDHNTASNTITLDKASSSVSWVTSGAASRYKRLLPNRISVYSESPADVTEQISTSIERMTEASQTLEVSEKFLGNSLTLWRSSLWNKAEILEENKYIRSIWSALYDYVARRTHDTGTIITNDDLEGIKDKLIYDGNINKLSFGNNSQVATGTAASFLIKDQSYLKSIENKVRIAQTGSPLRRLSLAEFCQVSGINISGDTIPYEASYVDHTEDYFRFVVNTCNGFRTVAPTALKETYETLRAALPTAGYESKDTDINEVYDDLQVCMNSILFTRDDANQIVPLCTGVSQFMISHNLYAPSNPNEAMYLLNAVEYLSYLGCEAKPYDKAIALLLKGADGYPEIFFAVPDYDETTNHITWDFYEFTGSVSDLILNHGLKYFGITLSDDAYGYGSTYSEFIQSEGCMIQDYLNYVFKEQVSLDTEGTNGKVLIHVPTDADDLSISSNAVCYRFKTGNTYTFTQLESSDVDDEGTVTRKSRLVFDRTLSEGILDSDKVLLHDICYSSLMPEPETRTLPRFLDRCADLAGFSPVGYFDTDDNTFIMAVDNPLIRDTVSQNTRNMLEAVDGTALNLSSLEDILTGNLDVPAVEVSGLKIHKSAMFGLHGSTDSSGLYRYFKNNLLVHGTAYTSDLSKIYVDADVTQYLSRGDKVHIAGYNFPAYETTNVALNTFSALATSTYTDLEAFKDDADITSVVGTADSNYLYALATVEKKDGSVLLRKYKMPVSSEEDATYLNIDMPYDAVGEVLGIEITEDNYDKIKFNLFTNLDGNLCLKASITNLMIDGSAISEDVILSTNKTPYLSLETAAGLNYEFEAESRGSSTTSYQIMYGTEITEDVGDGDTLTLKAGILPEGLYAFSAQDIYYDMAGILTNRDPDYTPTENGRSVDGTGIERVYLASVVSSYVKYTNNGVMLNDDRNDIYFDANHLQVHTTLKNNLISFAEPTNSVEIDGTVYTTLMDAEQALAMYNATETDRINLIENDSLNESEPEGRPAAQAYIDELRAGLEDQVNQYRANIAFAFSGAPIISTAEGPVETGDMYWKQADVKPFKLVEVDGPSLIDQLKDYEIPEGGEGGFQEEASKELVTDIDNRYAVKAKLPIVVGHTPDGDPITELRSVLVCTKSLSAAQVTSLGISDYVAHTKDALVEQAPVYLDFNKHDEAENYTFKPSLIHSDNGVMIIDDKHFSGFAHVDLSTVKYGPMRIDGGHPLLEKLKYDPAESEDVYSSPMPMLVEITNRSLTLDGTPIDLSNTKKTFFVGTNAEGAGDQIGDINYEAFMAMEDLIIEDIGNVRNPITAPNNFLKSTEEAGRTIFAKVRYPVEFEAKKSSVKSLKVIAKDSTYVAFGYGEVPSYEDFYNQASAVAYITSNAKLLGAESFSMAASEAETRAFLESKAGTQFGILAVSTAGRPFEMVEVPATYNRVTSAAIVGADAGVLKLKFISEEDAMVEGSVHNRIYNTSVIIDGGAIGAIESYPFLVSDANGNSRQLDLDNVSSNGSQLVEDYNIDRATYSFSKMVYQFSHSNSELIDISFTDLGTSVGLFSDPSAGGESGAGINVISQTLSFENITVSDFTDDAIMLSSEIFDKGNTPRSSFSVVLSIEIEKDIPNQASTFNAATYGDYIDGGLPVYREVTDPLKADRAYSEKLSLETLEEMIAYGGYPTYFEDENHMYYEYDDDGNLQAMKNEYGNEIKLVNAENRYINQVTASGVVSNTYTEGSVPLPTEDIGNFTKAPAAKKLNVSELAEIHDEASDIDVSDCQAYFLDGILLIKAPKVDLTALNHTADISIGDECTHTDIENESIKDILGQVWEDEESKGFDDAYLEAHPLSFNPNEVTDEFTEEQTAELTALFNSEEYLAERKAAKEAYVVGALAVAGDVSIAISNEPKYEIGSISPYNEDGSISYSKSLSRILASITPYSISGNKLGVLGKKANGVTEFSIIKYTGTNEDDEFEDLVEFKMLGAGLTLGHDYCKVPYTTELLPKEVVYSGNLTHDIPEYYDELILPMDGYGFSPSADTAAITAAKRAFKIAHPLEDEYYIPWTIEGDESAIDTFTADHKLFTEEPLMNAKGETVQLIGSETYEPICPARKMRYNGLRGAISALGRIVKGGPVSADLFGSSGHLITFERDGVTHTSIYLDLTTFDSIEGDSINLKAEQFFEESDGETLGVLKEVGVQITADILANMEGDLGDDAINIVPISRYYDDDIVKNIGYSRVYSSTLYDDDHNLILNSGKISYTSRSTNERHLEYVPSGYKQQGNVWAIINPAQSEKCLVSDETGKILYVYSNHVDGTAEYNDTVITYDEAPESIKNVMSSINMMKSYQDEILSTDIDSRFVTRYFDGIADNDIGLSHVIDLLNHNQVTSSMSNNLEMAKAQGLSIYANGIRQYPAAQIGMNGDLSYYAPSTIFEVLVEDSVGTNLDVAFSGLGSSYEIITDKLVSQVYKNLPDGTFEKVTYASKLADMRYSMTENTYKGSGESRIKFIVVRNKNNEIVEWYFFDKPIYIDLSRSGLLLNRLITESVQVE